MDRERSFKIVRGHVPHWAVPGASEAGLSCAVGVVLSTFRESAGEMVLDHALWFACVEAVAGVVESTAAAVHARAPKRFLESVRRPRLGACVGSLDDYGRKLLADPSDEKIDTDVWDAILWRKGDAVEAAATRESWYAAGGPAPYHDSYTTAIVVAPARRAALVEAVAAKGREAGGWLEGTVENDAVD